jgi:hypothetical protein
MRNEPSTTGIVKQRVSPTRHTKLIVAAAITASIVISHLQDDAASVSDDFAMCTCSHIAMRLLPNGPVLICPAFSRRGTISAIPTQQAHTRHSGTIRPLTPHAEKH